MMPTIITLIELGERIRLARLRRGLTMMQTAERANISRETLKRAESGDGGTSLAVLLRVLVVLGLDKDLALIAADDVLGRKLQDLALPVRRRASKTVRESSSTSSSEKPRVGGVHG
jgi:transcriptional regulator with XRE-family HTH domain